LEKEKCMNLLFETWILAAKKSQSQLVVAPWQITDHYLSDPLLHLNFGRPDFDGSIMQFLIGLLQTAFMPKDEEEWRKYYDNPPTTEVLKREFGRFSHAFELLSDGPRFMQDNKLSFSEKDAQAVAGLLIDQPGEQTSKENKDLFIKRDRIMRLSLPLTAAALFTLQLNAPSGGAGHRTSLRGGGPLTTLVVPEKDSTLWKVLWLNVLSQETSRKLRELSKENGENSDIFPWLSPTRTSENDRAVYPSDADWRMLYWATPRRIVLGDTISTPCNLSGQHPAVASYVTKNYGANYLSWIHPLSPYYTSKGQKLPLHPNLSGMTYRHWLGWTYGRAGKTTIDPAAVVAVAKSSDDRKDIPTTLWAFGYDMDNMKARGWQESKVPLFNLETKDTGYGSESTAFRNIVENIIFATEEVVSNLRSAIKNAWKTDRGDLGFVELEFWQTTETDFRDLLNDIFERVKASLTDSCDDLKQNWHQKICAKSLSLFEEKTMLADIAFEDLKQIVSERIKLSQFNYKKSIREALALPQKRQGKQKGEGKWKPSKSSLKK
jgi:CRISPR system Cascade subunit CasA